MSCTDIVERTIVTRLYKSEEVFNIGCNEDLGFIESPSKEFIRQLKLINKFDFDDSVDLSEKLNKGLKEKKIFINDVDTVLNGIIKENRPISEENLFRICFALELTPEETQNIFFKTFELRGFNLRNINDFIYYYCLKEGKSYKEGNELINKIYNIYKKKNGIEDKSKSQNNKEMSDEEKKAYKREADKKRKYDKKLTKNKYSDFATEYHKNIIVESLKILDWEVEEEINIWYNSFISEFTGFSTTATLYYMKYMYDLRKNLLKIILRNGRTIISFSDDNRDDEIDNFEIIEKFIKNIQKYAKSVDGENAKYKKLSEELKFFENYEAYEFLALYSAFEDSIHNNIKDMKSEKKIAEIENAWNKVIKAIENCFEDEGEEASNNMEYKFEMLKEKEKFLKPLLDITDLFWCLFSYNYFCKKYASSTGEKGKNKNKLKNEMSKEIFDSIPGMPNYMRPETWRKIDSNPNLITLRKAISDPNIASKECRDDIIGRKIIMIVFLYRFISMAMVKGEIPDNAFNNFIKEMNSFLPKCGFNTIYCRNKFDGLLYACLKDFIEKFSESPQIYKFSKNFISEVIGLNTKVKQDEWTKIKNKVNENEKKSFNKNYN